MRVLHVFDHSIPLHSGYSFRSCAILREQRKAGWETLHVTGPKHGQSAGTAPGEELVEDLLFYRTAPPHGIAARLPVVNQWAVIAALQQRLLELIPRLRPDVLHAHSPALNGQAALTAAARFSLPLVYEVRAFWEDAAVDHGTSSQEGVRYRLTRALETRVLRRADAVVTICEGLRGEIAGRGIDPGKITVVPNAVDAQQFRSGQAADAALRTALGVDRKRVLGFLGSFYAYEGLDLLVSALPDILRQIPDVHLLLVGGGPQDENLKRQVDELGLQCAVTFTGRVPHGEVQRYYDLVDVLVYPRHSMRLTELVTPLKPLEAMAQGKLVVASDVGGHRELLRDGETGSLFRAGDARALAGAVVDLLARPDSWPARRAAGRRFVELERTWPSSVARYRDVYSSVLSAARYEPAVE